MSPNQSTLKATRKTMSFPGSAISYTIFEGPRGGQYIQYNGKMTSLAKLRKQQAKQPTMAAIQTEDPILARIGFLVAWIMDILDKGNREPQDFILQLQKKKTASFSVKPNILYDVTFGCDRTATTEKLLKPFLEKVKETLKLEKGEEAVASALFRKEKGILSILGSFQPQDSSAPPLLSGREVTLRVHVDKSWGPECTFVVHISDKGCFAAKILK